MSEKSGRFYIVGSLRNFVDAVNTCDGDGDDGDDGDGGDGDDGDGGDGNPVD